MDDRGPTLHSRSPSLTSGSSQEGYPHPDPPWSHKDSPARQHSHCSQLSQSSQQPGDQEDKVRKSDSFSPTIHNHVTPQEKQKISPEHRGTPTTERSTPGGSRVLTPKRPRTPDSQGRHEGHKSKKPCPTDIRPGPMTTSSQLHRQQESKRMFHNLKQLVIRHQGPVSKAASPQIPTKGWRDSGGDLLSGNPKSGNPVPVRVLSKDQGKEMTSGGKGRGESMGRAASTTPKAVCSSGFPVHTHRSRQKRRARPQSRRSTLQEDDLFTPDPVVVVSGSQCKTAKPSSDEKKDTLSLFPFGAFRNSASGSRSPSRMAPCPLTVLSSDPKIVSLEPRVSLMKLSPPTDGGSADPLASPALRLSTHELVQTKTEAAKSPVTLASSQPFKDKERPKSVSPRPSPSTTPSDRLGGREGQRPGRGKEKEEEEDFLDEELSLSLGMDFNLTQRSSSSSSSEDDVLLSLQQIMDASVRPPATPEKGAYPAPSTPLRRGSQPNHQSVSSRVKSVNYRNTLDDLLKEKLSNQRSETEMKLLLSCAEDLLRLEEEEENDKNMHEAISIKQKELQREQRLSMLSSAVRDLHPGEEVFCLSYVGRLFNQDTLRLGQCHATTQGTARKTVLRPDQLRFQLSTGVLLAAYRSCPCPPQVSRWLFQMMSVHTESSVAHQILQILRDIAFAAAEHIEVNQSPQFEVWVPSVGDVTLVLMNMGAPYVTLFPLASLQPAFTEGDLLEGIQVSTESLSSKKEPGTFPDHNFENVIRYLSDVTALCPRAYSDAELLLLLTLVSKVCLETQLALLPPDHLRSLEHSLVNNMRDWNHMLPRICQALPALTEDHHNLRRLLQLLPDNTRGLQLRRHLSMSMISKLLNQRCIYTPTNSEVQLSDLRPYMRHMRPSALLRSLQSSRRRWRQGEDEDGGTRGQEDEEDEDDEDVLDQQAYYLSYSLLALANEAANFPFFPLSQREQLRLLCAELEKHIKCDIRESKKCLYRSKVKDFVARIYTKWQVLLQKTRPLQGKLYDYWQPLPEEMPDNQEQGRQQLEAI